MVERKESGVIQLGDDWPGVFIRCDEATYYASALSGIGGDTGELRSLLRSCGEADKGVTRYVRAPEGDVVLSAEEAEDVKAAFDELMAGVGKIAIQDYARLNRAGIVLARITEERE